MRISGVLTTLGVSILLALPALAITTPAEPWNPLNPSDELNLYEIYNALYGTSFSSNSDLDALQVDMEVFNLGGQPVGFVDARARYAGSTQRFGYYQPVDGNPPVRTELFNVTDYGLLLGYTAAISPSGDFGFYLDPEGGRAGGELWYSQDALNGGEEHFLVYSTPSPAVFMLAWEDLRFRISDFDYNDLVVEVTLGPKNIVPEPASMLLMGMGIAGMALVKFRKGQSVS